jgi:Tol biopolymer transport system component
MAVGLLALTSTSLPAEAQVTVRASVAANGDEGNGLSFLPAISPDGRNVSFTSAANNLLAPPKQDTNGMRDVFVHDRNTGEITRVSVSSDGEQANGHSGSSSIFADGRFIAFASTATNLVPDDTNGANDVFLHDRKTGQTTRVSVSSSGEQGNAASHTPAISADGRYVAFESAANNLVPGDTNTVWDIFVHDRISGETSRVSVSSSGGQSDADSRFASISADGRYVAFTSDAHNLVSGPSNFRTDVYVHDRQTGQTERVSVSSSGELGNDNSLHNDISADGRYVAFSSFATNLHPNDQTASEDVFVHDRVTGETTLESISTSGQQANSWSFWPAISCNTPQNLGARLRWIRIPDRRRIRCDGSEGSLRHSSKRRSRCRRSKARRQWRNWRASTKCTQTRSASGRSSCSMRCRRSSAGGVSMMRQRRKS